MGNLARQRCHISFPGWFPCALWSGPGILGHSLLINPHAALPARLQLKTVIFAKNEWLHFPRYSCPTSLSHLSSTGLSCSEKFPLRCYLLFSNWLALVSFTFLLVASAIPVSLMPAAVSSCCFKMSHTGTFLSLHLGSLRWTRASGDVWSQCTPNWKQTSQRKRTSVVPPSPHRTAQSKGWIHNFFLVEEDKTLFSPTLFFFTPFLFNSWGQSFLFVLFSLFLGPESASGTY